MMSTQYNYAGIDIAKRNFVIAVSSLSKTQTETNNQKGIAHTIEYLKKHNVALHLGFKVCAILRWGVWRSHERG